MEKPYKHFIYGLVVPFIYTLASFVSLFIDSNTMLLPAILIAVLYVPVKKKFSLKAKIHIIQSDFLPEHL